MNVSNSERLEAAGLALGSLLTSAVLWGCAASGEPVRTSYGSASDQAVAHAPKLEVVQDFGAFVPAGQTPASQPEYRQVPFERVTSAVPWGRGIAWYDGDLIVLSRGRHRKDGGVSQELDDHAGTLWRVDLSATERVVPGQNASQSVQTNATAFAKPTSPPFFVYDRSVPPQDDVLMGRPYCALAYDEASKNFFVCTYSGAELETGFRKHATDAIYRFDTRNGKWHVVEQHDPTTVPREALGAVISNEYYPHHDPATNPPPHGWANGPDGCVVAGDFLYVPSKDNHLVTQYDLATIRENSYAGPPDSRPVLGPRMVVKYPGGKREMEVLGASAVGVTKDHLYVSYRTSSIVLRLPLQPNGDLARASNGEIEAELIGVFQPWNPETNQSGNLYDITVSQDGVLFVSMGYAGRVWRIEPDPARPFYGDDQTGRPTTSAPWVDMSVELGKKAGCNNIYAAPDGYLYVSSRTNDTGAGEYAGTIYRVPQNPAGYALSSASDTSVAAR